MNITVRLFARARDLAGCDAVKLELPAGATVGDLKGRLLAEQPKLAAIIERSALAVNSEFANDGIVLEPNAEIALLPPVSGG